MNSGIADRRYVAALLLAFAVSSAWMLGFANLDAPSLWHDELVQVYVGRSIAETGEARLPSGERYFSGSAFSAILGAIIQTVGDSEFAVRAPSVILAGGNVVLLFLLARRLLGGPSAVVAAIGLAWSPWAVAWSRQARFYTLQQSLYLLTLLLVWESINRKNRRAGLYFGLGALAGYAAALFTSYHSILFLVPIGAYAAFMIIAEPVQRRRWFGIAGAVAAAGLVSVVAILAMMNPIDRNAIVDRGGLGGQLIDPWRAVRWYYVVWLRDNLSLGFLLTAGAGFALCLREGRRGVFAVLAFWGPMLTLTYLIGYRQERFMFFFYPLYIAAWAHALVVGVRWIAEARQSMFRVAAALLLLVFGARLAISAVALAGDSIETARGSNVTLARVHPQWRKPCLYVREHRTDEVVLTTSCLPALYYAGHVDEWYPNRYNPWEVQDCGIVGIATLEELQSYVRAHPRGFFIADRMNFDRWVNREDLRHIVEPEVAWVEANMTRVAEGSSEDVTLYAWGR